MASRRRGRARGRGEPTGLVYRSAKAGSRVQGIYRRSLMLASGRFAMLNDGVGFSLLPWRPVLEKRLGQSVASVVQRTGVNWDFRSLPTDIDLKPAGRDTTHCS